MIEATISQWVYEPQPLDPSAFTFTEPDGEKRVSRLVVVEVPVYRITDL